MGRFRVGIHERVESDGYHCGGGEFDDGLSRCNAHSATATLPGYARGEICHAQAEGNATKSSRWGRGGSRFCAKRRNSTWRVPRKSRLWCVGIGTGQLSRRDFVRRAAALGVSSSMIGRCSRPAARRRPRRAPRRRRPRRPPPRRPAPPPALARPRRPPRVPRPTAARQFAGGGRDAEQQHAHRDRRGGVEPRVDPRQRRDAEDRHQGRGRQGHAARLQGQAGRLVHRPGRLHPADHDRLSTSSSGRPGTRPIRASR